MKVFNTQPVTLTFEVLLIKIFFSTTEVINAVFQSNQCFQRIEFVDRPVPERLDIFRSFASRVRDIQVQSYPYKHMRDTYVTSDG